MQRGLGPQVLQLFWRGAPPEHLVTMRITPEALHELDPSPRLRELELVEGAQAGRHLAGQPLNVAHVLLVEGEVFGVDDRHPEEVALHGPELAVHTRLYTLNGEF
jgi:hypothetical protein